MHNWTEFSRAAPDLATAIRARFEAHLHHVLATLRADGSPRVSGTEARFFEDELYLGSMPGSRKGADLVRDGRYALHAATIDVELQDGDAKVSGIARLTDPEEGGRFLASLGHGDGADEASGDAAGETADEPVGVVFAAGIGEATLTRVQGDELVIDTWSEAGGLRTIRRK